MTDNLYEDPQTNGLIGLHALPLIPNQARIMLQADPGNRGALSIVREAHRHGRQPFVFVDSARPDLQHTRQMVRALQQLSIAHTVIFDSASGFVMQSIGVDLCVITGNKVASNGDVAGQIGAYNLAIIAHEHGVPFYVAAGVSTIDLSIQTGDPDVMGERASFEVAYMAAQPRALKRTSIMSPEYDMAPSDYITAIIAEAGVAYPPYPKSLPALIEKATPDISATGSE